jgi:hypothetical protein
MDAQGAPVTFGSALPKVRPEVGVQCGNAARINEPHMPVSFGTGARFREHGLGDFLGAPKGYFDSNGRASEYKEFDGAVLDMKAQLDKALRDRDLHARELREMTAMKVGLEKWKTEHRCEVSSDVMKLKEQNEQLHTALRDMMRGREEVFALLHQRRTVGSLLQETPRQYAPFAVSVPILENIPSAQSLLGDVNGGRNMRVEPDTSGLDLLRRPSGTAPGADPTKGLAAPQQAEKQPTGECLLRINSLNGAPFYVKRKLASQIRDGGQHVFVLMSLDGSITDEIHVSELESATMEGNTGLRLKTSQHEWALFLNAAERTRWIHWVYALNPFLSSQQTTSPHGGVPNSY